MPMYDACIIGAGPSGLSTALSASMRGARVAVLEEHREIGFLNARCGGLVSERCIRNLKLNLKGEYILNRVSEAVVHSPSGSLLTIKLGGECFVLDRVSFEKTLASKALNNNAEIYTGVKVKKLKFYKSHVEVETTSRAFESRIAVDASGALSIFTPAVLGLKPSLRRPIPSAQTEAKVNGLNGDEVHVFLGRCIAPGFFGWIIPLNSNKARIGLACERGNPTLFLKNLLKKLNVEDVYNVVKWPIITGGPLPKTFNSRFLSVGDAAGQSKPTTGGGIFTGTLCGLIAGVAIARRSEEHLVEAPRSYEKTWRKLLEYEFKMQRLYRQIFRILDDETLDYTVSFLKSISWNSLKDFDHHSKTIEYPLRNIKTILGKPGMYPLISKIILKTIGNLLAYSSVE
ncbi:NAD(P)/FAD-dependent oxidoreductase [Candidatus Bathyarchaeota archaeon]|nr:NAD(P)/FAD-dependent oxidoreductase [Candidatus Bathyarchaeota archaeon]MBS7613536.1 NAD(P)/FAD-dependent oxidoreductase [Candidatus Bathyarchaeota archaeon]